MTDLWYIKRAGDRYTCCYCFDIFHVSEAYVDPATGSTWDVCRPCGEHEYTTMHTVLLGMMQIAGTRP